MQILRKEGIRISNTDGTPLSSGLHLYWDAQFAQVASQHLGRFIPRVRYTPDARGVSFDSVFSSHENGRECCWRSKSFENPNAKIALTEVDELVSRIDTLHRQAEAPDTTPDTKEWIQNFTLPNPLVMKSAWRTLLGPSRLVVLWGYTSNTPEAQILPLTPTSSRWQDARSRTDLKELLLQQNRIGNSRWKWLQTLFAALWGLGLCILIFLFLSSHNGCATTYCDIHLDVPLQGKLCPRRCIVPSCGGHLAKDSGTRCENTCDKHPDTHLKNGLCEKCGEKPIPTFVAEVKLVDEKKSGQRFYPAFAVNSPDENTKALSWQWNAHIGNRAVAVSVEGEVCTLTDGLSANDTCVVDASATVSRNGRKVLLKARPYTWTKNLPPPESVERNLALYGDSRIDPKTQREYFTIKLYSQPEDGRASVSEWAAKLVDQEMPIPVTPCKDNTMRLYKTDIKQDGRIRITAHVEIEGGKARDISAVFVFKSDILSAEGDIDTSQVIDNATTIRKVWGNSVLLCYVPGVGQGTAFAVSQMDLITNYHVVGNKSDVELFFANSKPSERIDGKVVAVNKEADLAWLRTERGLQVNPFIVGLADDLLQKSSEVIAMGFPYWATESAEKDCKSIPDLWVSAGTIVSVAQGQFLHNAPITHGSSGGPLVSVGGELLGINTGSFYDVEEGEQTSSVMRAIPAVRIQECFPRLQLVGKGGR